MLTVPVPAHVLGLNAFFEASIIFFSSLPDSPVRHQPEDGRRGPFKPKPQTETEAPQLGVNAILGGESCRL